MNAASSSSRRLQALAFVLIAGCSQNTPGVPTAASISLSNFTSRQASLEVTWPDTSGRPQTRFLTAVVGTSNQCLHVSAPTDSVAVHLWSGDTITLPPADSIRAYEWIPTTNVLGLLVSAVDTGFTEEAATPLAC